MDIREYIKLCLVKRGITEAELARRTGQTRQNLSNKYSRGIFKNTELEKIAAALNASFEIRFIDNETGKPII